MITRIALALLLCVANIASAYAATLTSTVNRNQLSTNETLTLLVSYDGKADNSALTLGNLENDFEVLGISPQSNSSVTIVNGRTTQNTFTKWTITLVPKREGKLNIPAFIVNGAKSRPISISVDNATQGTSSGRPLEAFVSANHESVYVGQQLIITIELSAQSDVADLSGAPLNLANADIEPLGQQSFQRVDNGIARQVVELKYAVFAKQAGDLLIPAMTFTANQGGSRNFFGNRGKQVVARSLELPISVKAKSSDNGSAWFPAENVSLRSEWSSDRSQVQAGTPITRKIVITATGQRAEVIPPINNSGGDGNYKRYQDKPQLHTQTTTDGLIGTRIESEAIVASKGGELIIPELRLRWWNVKQQAWQEALLAEERLNVAGSTTAPAGVAPAASTDQQSEPGISQTTPLSQSPRLWQAISALLLLICVLLGCLLIRARKANANTLQAQKSSPTEKQAWHQLQLTLKQNKAAQIRQGIIDWAKLALPNEPLITIQALSAHANNAECAAALNALEQQLFNKGHDLDAEKLGKALTMIRQQALSSRQAANQQLIALKPLYQAD